MDIGTAIARRARQIEASGIRKVFDLAANLTSPINLSIGQPHFDADPAVKEEAIAWIRQGFNRYTPSGGIPELKQKLARLEPELTADGNDLMITSGVSGGIMLAFLALIDPGDEVLIPDPAFVSYKHVVTMAGGVPVFFDTYPDFRLYPERIAAKITPRTKLLIINSPSNPTGIVYTPEEIRQAADLCLAHDIIPVSDEIYRRFTYDGPAASIREHVDYTVVLRGFSKDYAITGWRMGYASGPAELISEMTKLQQFSFVNAPSFAQKACIAALDLDVSREIADYRGKRDRVCEALGDCLVFPRPEGAFYCFAEAPWGTGTDFVTAAVHNNLLIVPGGSFSERDTHFRISFAAADDDLAQGIAILQDLATRKP